MEKMCGNSMDLVKSNIEIIEKLFPEVITEEEFNGKIEKKIDMDKFKLLLGDYVSDKEERYELRWNGKNDAIRFAQTPSSGTLRPDRESSKNWDDTENLYIEGDNLEVLKLLQKSYFGKVKMIYIDPPYNTGSDFVYKDDFKDNIKNYKEQTGQDKIINSENGGRYHTNWINMIYPRLKVARNILLEDGVIFISINDIEENNLKRICDEIFGEDNFISKLIWQNKKGGGNDSKYIAVEHEYILMYCKNKTCLEELYEKYSDEYLKRYKEEDEKGKFYWDTFKRKSGKQYYSIECPDGTILKNDDLGNPISWLRSEARFKEDLINGEVRIIKINEKWSVQFKQRLPKGKKPRSICMFEESLLSDKGKTSDGNAEILKIFKKELFQNSKPVSLINYLIGILCDKDDIILDFFSGSATTAHAVMQLNAEDGGNRKFIMVQLPEITPEKSEARKAGYENICEIGKERIRRAGDMIVNENKDKEGIEDLDIGFKVFKLDSSNIKEWDPDYENLEYSLFERQDIIKMGRTNEDLLYEIIIKMGIEPTVGIEEIKFGEKTIYNIGMDALLICLEDEITEDLVAEIPNHKSIIDEMKTKVVFKESGFRTDSDKMNAIQKLKQFGITDVRSV